MNTQKQLQRKKLREINRSQGSIASHTSIHSQGILFLCEDNYYRSRYAEEFLNYRAELLGMPWRAVSKGLDESCKEFAQSSFIHPKVFEFAESKVFRFWDPIVFLCELRKPTFLSMTGSLP